MLQEKYELDRDKKKEYLPEKESLQTLLYFTFILLQACSFLTLL
jgi:hypothetical protein